MGDFDLSTEQKTLSREIESVLGCDPVVEVHPWKTVVDQKYLTGRYLRLVDHKADREIIVCRTSVANDESYSFSFNRERKAFVISNGSGKANWSELSRNELACLIVYLQQAQAVGTELVPEPILRKLVEIGG